MLLKMFHFTHRSGFLTLFVLGVTLCPRQIILLVVGASGSCKSEIFREFLKFVKVFGLKSFLIKYFVFRG